MVQVVRGHQAIVQLFEDIVKSLSDNIQFGYGRRTEFNQKTSPTSDWVWMLPLTANPAFRVNDVEMYNKQWNVILLFMRKDRTDSVEDEYKPILDDLDTVLDRFVIALNDWYTNQADTVGAIVIRGFSQTPFIKTDADIFTGWFLSFQLIAPDDFEYCP